MNFSEKLQRLDNATIYGIMSDIWAIFGAIPETEQERRYFWYQVLSELNGIVDRRIAAEWSEDKEA